MASARAPAARPRLLLAAVPSGYLDAATAQTVMTEMLNLVTEVGAAMLLVTHSPTLAAQMGRQAHLSGGLLT